MQQGRAVVVLALEGWQSLRNGVDLGLKKLFGGSQEAWSYFHPLHTVSNAVLRGNQISLLLSRRVELCLVTCLSASNKALLTLSSYFSHQYFLSLPLSHPWFF